MLFALQPILVNAQLAVTGITSGTTFITYNQSTTVNMIINGGAGPYTANLVWCKPQPGGSCVLPSGTSLSNTITVSLPASGNYLAFTVNASSYNTLQVTFNSVTYNIITPAVISTNIIAATNMMNPSNTVFSNTVYGAWQFNGIVKDSGTNTLALSVQPNAIPVIGVMPATPELDYLAPGGFLSYVTNFGNNTLTLITIVPSNIAASNITAVIPVGVGPKSLVAPPQMMSATAPTIVGTVNYGANSISVINTATKQVMATMNLGNGAEPVAVAPEANSIGFGMAFADYGTDNITIMSPAQSGPRPFSAFNISLAGKISGPDALDTFFDRSGNPILYVAGNLSNSIVPINLQTMTVGNVIQLGSGAAPRGVAATFFGYVYVADFGTNTVSVINASSTNPGVVANITGAGNLALNGPASITIDPKVPKLYVTNYNSNTIAIINPFTDNILSAVVVNSLAVSRPISVTSSPDGKLLYVANFGANVISVLKSSDDSIQGTLPAKEPTSISLFSNFFYNGTTPSNVIFSISTPGNQLSATLLYGSNVVGTTTNTLQYALASGAATNFRFSFSTGGNGNYLPMFMSKTFDVMPSFPQIKMRFSFANGTNVLLNSQNQTMNLSGSPSAIFPLTVTVNIVTANNQMPANIYLDGSPVNSFSQGFSTTYNSLGAGTQSFVFNSVSNGNYMSVDPTINLVVLQTPLGGGGGASTVSEMFEDNLTNITNSSAPVFRIYLTGGGSSVSSGLYQGQLPDTMTFGTSQMLDVSVACSFTSNGRVYLFTGTAYGLGANVQCNHNYTVYGGTIESLYRAQASSSSITSTSVNSTAPSSSTSAVSTSPSSASSTVSSMTTAQAATTQAQNTTTAGSTTTIPTGTGQPNILQQIWDWIVSFFSHL
ncbi:MAG: hypothetical protein KGH72_02980 [Candidatus Micrarchaeota archaeon]|nr:hypothetical protein [Candidatus Micrarchaeota archaeon]